MKDGCQEDIVDEGKRENDTRAGLKIRGTGLMERWIHIMVSMRRSGGGLTLSLQPSVKQGVPDQSPKSKSGWFTTAAKNVTITESLSGVNRGQNNKHGIREVLTLNSNPAPRNKLNSAKGSGGSPLQLQRYLQPKEANIWTKD